MDRIRLWFAGGRRRRNGPDEEMKAWSLSPAQAELALATAGAPGGEIRDEGLVDTDEPPPPEPLAEIPETRGAKPASDQTEDRAETSREEPAAPAAPPWLDRLDALPDRIADALKGSAASTEALGRIAAEMEARRDTDRGAAEAMAALPESAERQADLVGRTNELLEHQNRLTESLVDGLAGLRAAFRSVEESSRRHLACIAQLETTHRQVLDVYQSTLLRAHRRLGRLALFAVGLAVAALGAVGALIYLGYVVP
jgi:hypothetical protein